MINLKKIFFLFALNEFIYDLEEYFLCKKSKILVILIRVILYLTKE